MSYEKTVAAALAETQSKFALAEALATEIPPTRGRDADTTTKLTEARQAIIDAGGETRAVQTLAEYRSTAQWVFLGYTQEFRWLPGVSFTAHNEARQAAGLSYDEFAAMSTKTVEAVRKSTGKSGIYGPPATIINRMTPAEIVEAMKDPAARHKINTARNQYDDATDEAQRQRALDLPEHVKDARELAEDDLQMLASFRKIGRAIRETSDLVLNRPVPEDPEDYTVMIDWDINALTILRSKLEDPTMDINDEWARISGGDGS